MVLGRGRTAARPRAAGAASCLWPRRAEPVPSSGAGDAGLRFRGVGNGVHRCEVGVVRSRLGATRPEGACSRTPARVPFSPRADRPEARVRPEGPFRPARREPVPDAAPRRKSPVRYGVAGSVRCLRTVVLCSAHGRTGAPAHRRIGVGVGASGSASVSGEIPRAATLTPGATPARPLAAPSGFATTKLTAASLRPPPHRRSWLERLTGFAPRRVLFAYDRPPGSRASPAAAEVAEKPPGPGPASPQAAGPSTAAPSPSPLRRELLTDDRASSRAGSTVTAAATVSAGKP